MEYLDALDRGLDACPEIDGEASRLDVPTPAGETDGSFTRLVNLPDIADALSRDPDHLFRYVRSELATSAQFEEGRARFSGSFSVAEFEAAVDAYVSEYVTCGECGLPDTRLQTEDGTRMLRCDACGAFRPVQKRAESAAESRPTVEEGRTYELEITGTGRKGDGVAERGGYTVFVSGAREGQTVTALIESVSGSLAFGRVAN